jgi:23S rRNA pseudouridine2605 synthase
MTRLNKYIAECGITSRRKAEELILQGRVTINNKTITKLSFEVDPQKDEIALDGEKIKRAEHVYFLLNKPKGVVTTTDDEKGRFTVNDILKTKQKIFPVGRLDYNTTGVIILTNDGEFANKILHPSNNVIREYEVKLDRDLELFDEEKLLKGIFLENKRGTFQTITYLKKKDRKNVTVRCTEGRNHFVKKMFGALQYRVEKLHRKSFAGITADVPVGTYRKLTKDELQKLSPKY